MSINNFIKRTSVRNFINYKISDQEIKQIKQIINNAPTSWNHQQFSAIIIINQKLKNMIAINNSNQQHIKDCALFILFLADRTRMKKIISDNNLKLNKGFREFEILRTITDANIAATYTHDALIEMGYGVTMVGGILRFVKLLQKELNIPQSALPILGLSIGKSSKINEVKPKMNKVFVNKYNIKKSLLNQKIYSQTSKDYFVKNGEKDYISELTKFCKFATNSKSFEKIGKILKESFEKMFD